MWPWSNLPHQGWLRRHTRNKPTPSLYTFHGKTVFKQKRKIVKKQQFLWSVDEKCTFQAKHTSRRHPIKTDVSVQLNVFVWKPRFHRKCTNLASARPSTLILNQISTPGYPQAGPDGTLWSIHGTVLPPPHYADPPPPDMHSERGLFLGHLGARISTKSKQICISYLMAPPPYHQMIYIYMYVHILYIHTYRYIHTPYMGRARPLGPAHVRYMYVPITMYIWYMHVYIY
jgi:hypothetical protein